MTAPLQPCCELESSGRGSALVAWARQGLVSHWNVMGEQSLLLTSSTQLMLLSMSAHRPEARNELHPSWSPGPASAQHTATLLHAQLLSGELPGKGEALSKHRAAM